MSRSESVHRVTQHGKLENLQEYAQQSRKTDKFCDVCIKTGDVIFPAHRLVLSCFSQFFEKLFMTPMREQSQKTVELYNLDANSVKTLVDFMYTRNINIEYENVFELLSTAHYLQMNDVCQFCFDYLRETITTDNWSMILSTCRLYENDLLSKELHLFIGENFDKIAQSDIFKELEIEALTSIVRNLKILVAEKSLYEALMGWIRRDEVNRNSELPYLLSLLELQRLPSEFLENVVARDFLVKENARCLDTVMTALTKRLRNRTIDEKGLKLLSIGGVRTQSKVAEVYNVHGESNDVYPDLPHQLFYSKSLIMSNSIYNIGGNLGLHFPVATNKAYRMTENQQIWEEIAPMSQKKCYISVAAFCDCIVAVGGVSMSKARSTSEAYFPALNKWRPISNLNHSRSEAELVVCDGSLYALGGKDGQKTLTSVERLNDLNDSKWEVIEPMTFPRRMFTAVSYNREIYVIGGGYLDHSNSVVRLKLVEKFSPAEVKWSTVCDMRTERRGHAACMLNGKIYVVGGDDTSGKTVKLVECYDPSKDVWTDVSEVQDELFGHSLIAL